MKIRPFAISLAALMALAVIGADAQAAAPLLVSATSRKVHGAASYDIGLPLTGNSGIECRNLAAGTTLVLNFDQTVTAGSASVTAGTATVIGYETRQIHYAVQTTPNIEHPTEPTPRVGHRLQAGQWKNLP